MFLDLDHFHSYVHDYSSFYKVFREYSEQSIRRTQFVQQLCETGCGQSTAYAAINKYNFTTNDRGMTMLALKYLGIGLLISYEN